MDGRETTTREASNELAVLQLRSSAGMYGADRMVLTLNGALAGAGVDSRLSCINNYRLPEQNLYRAAAARGQDATLLPCRRRIDLTTVSHLAREVRRHRASILHVHDYKSAFYAWLATRGQPVNIPVNKPVIRVATMHGQVDGSRTLRLYNRIELALLRRFDALVAVSGRQVQLLRDAGVPDHRIHLIDNAIELPATTPRRIESVRRELGLVPGHYVFAAVARFSPEKNLALLVDAFAAIARTRADCLLLLAGDGPEADNLRERVRSLGLGARVRFAGNRDDMDDIYPLIDCLVLPSLTEGMPLVVLEAMANAIPVIASDVGEVTRLLAHSEHGRTVPPANFDALVDAMQAALACPGQRDPHARLHVETHHSPAAMAGRYAALYRSLMEPSRERQAA